MNNVVQIEKNVFLVFYAGERAKAKILKICEAFGANRYPFNEELGKQSQMIAEVRILFYFMSLVLRKSFCHIYLIIYFPEAVCYAASF